jgi:hypothetical protein
MIPVSTSGSLLVAKRLLLLAIATMLIHGVGGCSLGPKSLLHTRIRYNDAVKSTSEQQLLLNIVRLRYTDTPSSLAISAIADQQEIGTSIQAVPFFTAAGAGDFGSYGDSILPQVGLSGVTRPTLSYTPLDDEDFTRRLFTPISLEGVAYLSKTTWPISTVFRLYLENLNWVSNAETASGPTPSEPPEFATFLEGITALQNLQDRNLVTLHTEERTEVLRNPVDAASMSATEAVECIKNDIVIDHTPAGLSLTRKKRQPVLRVAQIEPNDMDWMRFTNAFHLDPSLHTFDLTYEMLDPYLKDAPQTGLDRLDFETRSLLQVLFFVSHGIEVPTEHLENHIAPGTCDHNGKWFDWSQVLGGLFRVCSIKSHKKPEHAYVAVRYKDHWFYIDERDRATKSTFALLLEVSRLELGTPDKQVPILTIPLGR